MPQVGLVAHQHDDDVLVGMVAQFPQPPLHVLVGQMLGNVIDEQGPHGTAVVGRGDGAITLLAGRIPDLRFNCFAIDLRWMHKKDETKDSIRIVSVIGNFATKCLRRIRFENEYTSIGIQYSHITNIN